MATDPNAVLTAITPRAAPAIAASNNAQDRASGIAAELTPVEQAAATTARATATPDILPKADPPAADTVDAPQADAAEPADAPAPDAEDAPTDPPAVAKPDAPADDHDMVEVEIDGKKVKVNLQAYAKREITKARNRQRNAEAEVAKLRQQADDAQKALAELAAKVPAPVEATPPAAEPRPTREAFDTPDAYDDAIIAWGEREGVRKTEAKATADRMAAEKTATETAEKTRRAEADAELAKLNTDYATRKAVAIEKWPDFIEVTETHPDAGGPNITTAMAHSIMAEDNGPDVAYHLGKNVAEALRISKLPLLRQGVEIGKIAARLAMPAPTPARRRAPDPITPLNGSNAPADTSDREPSMEDYAKVRMRQLAAERQPFIRAH